VQCEVRPAEKPVLLPNLNLLQPGRCFCQSTDKDTQIFGTSTVPRSHSSLRTCSRFQDAFCFLPVGNLLVFLLDADESISSPEMRCSVCLFDTFKPVTRHPASPIADKVDTSS
jgi:hypothetical protein